MPSIRTMGYGSPRSAGISQGSERRTAAVDGGRPHSPVCEHFGQDQAVGGVVVHDQNVQTFQMRRLRLGGVRIVGGLHPHLDREPERAAPPWLAFDPDLAAHQIDQLLRDGKPQARAAVTPGRRPVGLLERLKDRLQFVAQVCRCPYRRRKFAA